MYWSLEKELSLLCHLDIFCVQDWEKIRAILDFKIIIGSFIISLYQIRTHPQR